MLQRIMKISTVIILLTMLLPGQIFAISSSDEYTIESYNIDMKVNENNTFDITETITANFTGYNKHGIYRKIPLKNKIERLDGTISSNKAKITNISVSDEFKTSNENGYKVLKIGNANKTVRGKKTYTIKYTYNIGKDPLKDSDELYFNLIGTEWDTTISNITFSITMPKEFDSSKLGFSTGSKYSTNSANVTYKVKGNVITGSVITKLYSEQGLTVRLTLPEGYFVGANIGFDYMVLLRIGISIICVIIAYIIWSKYGKDEMVIDTVEFYPPDNLNSAEIAFLYRGYSQNKDIVPLLIHLANKGYLRIEEYEETKLKVFKSKNFKIIKVRDYDGNDENERSFFKYLFMIRDEVTQADLYIQRFSTFVNDITSRINRKENVEKIFEKKSLKKRGILLVMLVIILIVMGEFSTLKKENFEIIITVVCTLIIMMFILYNRSNVGTVILGSIAFVGTGFFCMLSSEGVISTSLIIEFLIHSVCMVSLIIFIAILKKRTPYGTKMLGRIQGFKNFLEVAEKDKLEQLVMDDPKYYYNILPYAYVLDVSNKWMQKFENIAMEAPSWYYGDSEFSVDSFNNFMNSTYSSISRNMTNDSMNYGESGGGSSGGGSGGGGGGSW